MQSNPIAAGAAAGGSSASLAIVLVWLLTQFHVQMPTEVALAIAAMALPPIHAVILKLGAPPSATPAAAGTQPPAS
jgi:hypothetical protein